MLLTFGDRHGQRQFERLITGMLLVIAVGFLASLVVRLPAAADVVGGLVPASRASKVAGHSHAGATVMPHAVYLHLRWPVIGTVTTAR